MPLVFGAIAPHGGDIVEEIADDPGAMAHTRAAMRALGQRFADAGIDTVVVLTPHGIIPEGAISVGATRKAGGILGEPDGRHIQAIFDCDEEFVAGLRLACGERLPLAPLVGEEEREDAVLPLDWGALIPLWFTAQAVPEPRPRVVVCAPDRGLPREVLVRFGVAIAEVAETTERRVALIASCDQGHAHDPEGPYGYDPASVEHDRAMCDAIVADDLPSLIDWPQEFLETAKVDAFWQTIILAGALGVVPMRGELLSYEAPTYFGMAVAAYEPR